jgi:hypothetical protein
LTLIDVQAQFPDIFKALDGSGDGELLHIYGGWNFPP